MTIGLDFDNTIAGYDRAFAAEAARRGLVPPGMVMTKRAIKGLLGDRPDGARLWMEVQGQVYGPRMHEAELIEGVADFLARCRAAGRPVVVVSHKTRFGHFDPTRTDLRAVARDWMADCGLFALGLGEQEVFFEETRDAKIARIAACKCVAFVDDLEEVLRHSAFPADTARFLFHPDPGPLPAGPFVARRRWEELSDDLLGQV